MIEISSELGHSATESAPLRDRQRTDVTLVSCMRNEGLFLVEWVAYHSLMGFEDIVIFTNNCTDGSDLLLDRLHELGYLTHVRQYPLPGTSPQLNAMEIAFEHPIVKSHEWMLHIDADEFLYIDTKEGTVGSLIKRVQPADVIALAWKCFGSGGLTRWSGGSVLETFTYSQGKPMRRISFHKSMFRPKLFEFATDHMPKMPKRDDVCLTNSAGESFVSDTISKRRKSRYKIPFRYTTYQNAAIYHYAVKSDDLYLMKNDRGDGHGVVHTKYFLNSDSHARYNRNEVEDRSILHGWAKIYERINKIRSDEKVAQLEEECISAFNIRRDQVLTAQQVANWSFAARGSLKSFSKHND